MFSDHNESESVKEVYARFGLAVYWAQVLEHQIVNALLVLDLFSSQNHRVRSSNEWASEVDAFMDRHFAATMGRMMKNLQAVTQVDKTLEDLLCEALKKRNYLVHSFFRERATIFMSIEGRQQMLQEVDACTSLFQAADRGLENIITPLRRKAGITDDQLDQEYRRLLDADI